MTRSHTRFLGRFQLGVELPLLLVTQGATEPGWPADNPVVTILKPNGTLCYRARMGADQQGVSPGTFRLPVFLDERFSAEGLYAVAFHYRDAVGNVKGDAAAFALIPGGNAAGAVIGLKPSRRPDAVYLLRQTDAGTISRGKNPR